MENFLTLVALPEQTGALQTAISTAQSCLRTEGLSLAGQHWLHEGVACDILFHGGEPRDLEERVRNGLTDMPVDMYAGHIAGRRKKALIADMDSTMVTTETLDDMAALMGVKDVIADITTRGLRGEISFEDSVRQRLHMIAGLGMEKVEEAIAAMTLNPGAETLVRTMRSNGAYTALVSGGFTLFTQDIQMRCGFHEHRSNVLGVENKKLTGEIIGPILGREAKREAMDELAGTHNLSREDFLTIGDGANDLDMIRNAGLGIAYFGKPILLAAAPASIRYTDFAAALYYQGYTAEELMTA